jgi:hypothetical protein
MLCMFLFTTSKRIQDIIHIHEYIFYDEYIKNLVAPWKVVEALVT